MTVSASISAGHVVIAGAFKIATAKTVVAGVGSYAVTGTAATPKLGRKVAATTPASYALAGVNATTTRGSATTVTTNVATTAVGNVSVTTVQNISVDLTVGLTLSTASVGTVSVGGSTSATLATNLATASVGDVTVNIAASAVRSSVPINPAAFLPFLVR